jgi:cold shock CspA family protein
MVDQILEGYIKDFLEIQGLSCLRESEAFERFVNYTLVSRVTGDDFDIEQVSIGKGDDTAIDGLAILVNDHVVSSTDEIDYFRDKLKRFEIRFVFVQSKKSSKFEASEVGNFLFGVQNFFEKDSHVKMNDDIRELRKLQQYIYDNSIHMTTPPSCEAFYVTTGKWLNDKNVRGRAEAEVKKLKETDLFSVVNFSPIDLKTIKRYYSELRHKIVREIEFDKATALPQINNITESYLGILPCSKYIKLITDNDGNLLHSLFYSNVRDFQGNNPVNNEIAGTIKDSKSNDLFALLNNGVTIVAKYVNRVGDKFRINDFQIVNGCQTSHLLYRNQKHITDSMYLPIKLIVTDNSQVTNKIIRATNRQTEIKDEAFESLSPFHKTLEEFYATFDKDPHKRLYYERRSKQYESLPIPKYKIITLTAQIYSFIAMFLNDPHSTHRYYGELLKANKNRIFLDDHFPDPYYVSGYALYFVEQLFRQNTFPLFFKKFRYHLLLIFRLEVQGNKIEPFNSRKIQPQCVRLEEVLWNTTEATKIFEKGIELIQKTLKEVEYSPSEAARRRTFTEKLLRNLQLRADSHPPRFTGYVDWFNDPRGFGVLKDKDGRNYFVHHSAINMPGHKTLELGQTVTFSYFRNGDRNEAYDVRQERK